MAVPAHDSRDYDFALKYGIPIREVVMANDPSGYELQGAYTGEGFIVNSNCTSSGLNIDGLSNKEAALKVIEWAEKTWCGKKKVLVCDLTFAGTWSCLSVTISSIADKL